MESEISPTGSEQIKANSHPAIPVFNVLHPQSYENYPGNGTPPEQPSAVASDLRKPLYGDNEGTLPLDPRSIHAREMYARVPYKNQEGQPQTAVIRIADMYVNPDQYTPEPSNRPKATLIYLGGGDADALTSTGIAGYLRDAQLANRQSSEQTPQWDVSHMITIAHPSGAPRTERFVDKDNVRTSAAIVKAALDKAIAEGSLQLGDHVVLMGGSAGGAVQIELAALLGEKCEHLILEEPAAMATHPNLEIKFALSGFRDGFLRGMKNLGLLGAISEAAKEARTSFTLPYGTPKNWWELAKGYLRENPDYKLAHFFGIEQYAKQSGLNAGPLNHDSTEDARSKITCPVTLVSSLKSDVVNLFTATDRYTMQELSHLDLQNPQQKAKLKEKASSLVQKLFPNSSFPAIRLVEASSHAGLGRNPQVWRQLLEDVQSVPLPQNNPPLA